MSGEGSGDAPEAQLLDERVVADGAHALRDDLGPAVGGKLMDLARRAVEDQRMLQGGAGVRQIDELPGAESRNIVMAIELMLDLTSWLNTRRLYKASQQVHMSIASGFRAGVRRSHRRPLCT